MLSDFKKSKNHWFTTCFNQPKFCTSNKIFTVHPETPNSTKDGFRVPLQPPGTNHPPIGYIFEIKYKCTYLQHTRIECNFRIGPRPTLHRGKRNQTFRSKGLCIRSAVASRSIRHDGCRPAYRRCDTCTECTSDTCAHFLPTQRATIAKGLLDVSTWIRVMALLCVALFYNHFCWVERIEITALIVMECDDFFQSILIWCALQLQIFR